MPRSKGFRRRTRHLLSVGRRAKGLSQILIDYKLNDKVVIKLDPRQVKGMPHRRFQGKVGKVEEIRPRSLLVSVPIGNKIKKVVARFEHIKLHQPTVSQN
jgi:large subunit ribosomal protein L21e